MPRLSIRDLCRSVLTRTRTASRPFPARARLGMEGLEARELPASNLTAAFAGGVLRIDGTDQPDTIIVRTTGGQTSVDGATIAVGGTAQASVTGVTRVEVHAGAAPTSSGSPTPSRSPPAAWCWTAARGPT
jgi:hypothetical protein